ERRFDAIWRAGARLMEAGDALTDISERIVGTGVEIVKTYADYDLMLRRAATALNTNAFWQERLDEAIQQTAITLGMFKPEEVAEAYYLWGAASGVVVD